MVNILRALWKVLKPAEKAYEGKDKQKSLSVQGKPLFYGVVISYILDTCGQEAGLGLGGGT